MTPIGGGAPGRLTCDSSLPTGRLTDWVRDRRRGPRLGLALVVKRSTSETVDFLGLTGRGRPAVGRAVDLNVIDHDKLRIVHSERRYDLPAGGKRLAQRSDGYTGPRVSGAPILEPGAESGERPGRLACAGGIRTDQRRSRKAAAIF